MAKMKKIALKSPFAAHIRNFVFNLERLFGALKSSEINKLEIDSIIESTSLDRKWIRDKLLGHTVDTYKNWACFKDESGYSIWKFPLSDMKPSSENVLYLNDKEIENRGVAGSETITAFGGVLLYDGTCYTDVASEAASEGGTPFEVLNNASCYSLLIGDATCFSALDFEFETHGSNYALAGSYWDGATWSSLTFTADDTTNFVQNGRIEFNIPVSWAQCSIDGVTNYWLKMTTTTDPTIVAKVYHILPGDSVPTLLSLSSSQILNSEWTWCWFEGTKSVYVTIPNTGNAFYEGVRFIKSSSAESLKEQFFCVENSYKTDYQNADYVGFEVETKPENPVPHRLYYIKSLKQYARFADGFWHTF